MRRTSDEAREDDTTQTFYPEPNLSLIGIRQTGEQRAVRRRRRGAVHAARRGAARSRYRMRYRYIYLSPTGPGVNYPLT